MKARAFTLLELLIVVVIVSILAASALPSLEGMIWQSRFTEVFSTFGAIARAKAAHFAAHQYLRRDPSVLLCGLFGRKGHSVRQHTRPEGFGDHHSGQFLFSISDLSG